MGGRWIPVHFGGSGTIRVGHAASRPFEGYGVAGDVQGTKDKLWQGHGVWHRMVRAQIEVRETGVRTFGRIRGRDLSIYRLSRNACGGGSVHESLLRANET